MTVEQEDAVLAWLDAYKADQDRAAEELNR